MESAAALLICLLLGCGVARAAGPVVPNAPNAGAMLQQVQPGLPASAASSAVRLTLPEPPDSLVPRGIAFRVTSIQISGNTSIATDQLHQLVEDSEGQDLTLAAVSELAARITEHYQRQGFPLARAIVPGQAMLGGVLQVHVIEARYGDVLLVNQAPLRDALLRNTLSQVQSGQLIQQAPIDRALLSLSDIPGVLVTATMKPGSRLGEVDLEVKAAASSAGMSGSSGIDNYGNSYAGRTRASQSLRFTDPFIQQNGAALDINALSSGRGMNYGRVAYEGLLGDAFTHVGGAYSALQYALGGQLAASDSRGAAQVGQVWARRTLLRGTRTNLYSQFQFDNTRLRDHSGLDIDNNRHTGKVTASLSGDTPDLLWFGAVNNWNLSLAHGVVGFDDAAALLADGGQAAGRFTKLSGNFSRLQTLSPASSLFAALMLQWANRNLDPSEKMAIGGASSLRAADASAMSGDLGALLNLEYRQRLGAAWAGQWQLTAFVDSAIVQLNQTGRGPNDNLAQVSGAGIGLTWSGPGQIFVKAQLARLLGSASASMAGVTGPVRGWLEIACGF